ncbi:hypothetical protein A4U84_03740 [Glaesserella parasuis]|nr:hypothetical protein A4U84_03740 [Glaesserella parasuis]
MYEYKITILPSFEGKKENSFPPLAGEGARRADGGELNILFRPHPLRFTKGLPPLVGKKENSSPACGGRCPKGGWGRIKYSFRPHPLRFTKGLPPFMGEELILLSKNQCHTLEIKNPTFRLGF